MAGRDLGEGARLAAATGAWICFEDEAGQNLRPPKARTWAPRGHTPVVAVPGKGSGRVSAAGLVCLKPGSRGRLFYRVRVHRGRKGERRSMSEADYAGLIAAAHQQLHAHPVPARPHRRIPRPDRTHPRTPATIRRRKCWPFNLYQAIAEMTLPTPLTPYP